MTKKIKIIAICLVILISIGMTYCDYHSDQKALQEKLKTYAETTAIVKKAYAGTVTKRGGKRGSYDLSMLLADGKRVTMFRRTLGERFEVGDEIVIYYNPISPHDEIYLKSEN